MKLHLFLSLLFLPLLLTNCDDGKWWGNRKIDTIISSEKNLVVMTKFTYDSQDRLSAYSSKQIKSNNVGDPKVYFDVVIEYTDTAVVVKGWMPYVTLEENGYANGVTIYTLNKYSFAKSAVTTYDHMLDSTGGEKYVAYNSFMYNEKMMLKNMFVARHGVKLYLYKDYCIDYSPSRDVGGPIVQVSTTFINYTKDINKSNLVLAPFSRDLQQHVPAFYAKLLGRPSKYLVKEEAMADTFNSPQFTEDYTYELDDQGYVKSYTFAKSSSVRLVNSDPFAKKTTSVITYVD